MSDTTVTVTGPLVPGKRKRVTCLYNVQQYSDIIVTFGNRRVFAHKAILAASSLFFHPAFSSGFAVATNPEIDLGDDDNPDQVDIMLRVMYDDDTVYGLNRDFEDPNLTKTFLEYYVLGDKYDVPVVRQQAKDFFISELQGHVHLHVEQGAWRSDFFDDLAKGIAVVLGPSAITFGDRSIQEETIEWCARNLDHLLWHRTFRKLLSKGQMFSTEFAGKLLLIKARFEHVEFGWDLDPNDVYDDSSSDEDITQLESESEAEQDNNDDEEDDDEQEDDEERNNDDEESSNDDEESDDDDGIQVREYEVEEELGSNARL